ncbi:MAG TPA: DUF3413 domain-containing protein [Planctomycetes bacterium]|nr:DUF3413 domain-containing protein [Planctomycetota bacterium]
MPPSTDHRSPAAFSPEVRRRAAYRVWLANMIFASVLAANYLWHVPEVEGARAWFFALPALVSTTLSLTILPGWMFWLAAGHVRNTKALGLLQGIFWTVFQVLLFADTRVFNMFRYHMNAQVWNLIYVRGSSDAIHLGWQVWTSISTGLVAVIALQLYYWRRSMRRVARKIELGCSSTTIRPWILSAIVLLPVVFLEKTIYARADLTRDHQITHLAGIFPLYARVPMEDLASSVLGVDSGRPPKVELDGVRLNYPHALPAVDPDGPRPNVLVLVIDCLRQDRLAEPYAPHLARYAEDCRRFEDHISGGNSTRYGLFSLLYGLHGSYWFPVLGEERSPVLIDTLKELGYSFGIFGSASMEYPELRSTAWSSIEEDVHDDFGDGEPWQRDELAADALIEWMENASAEPDPFFAFFLIDSPHQVYSFPPGDAPFTPYAPELDYMSMTRNEGPDPELLHAVENRYNNAVHHADEVAGRVLDALAAVGDLENTLVVITGDHGEEFLECGFFGHTSAFTPPQVRVPFLMRGPGIEPGVESGPTSHLDFAPTLLEMLGANPEGRSAWCLGASLFAPDPNRRRVIGAWNELGVWAPDGILRVPLSAFEFNIESYDYGWNLIEDDRQLLDDEAGTLETLGAECNRFLR